jgi:hypothetical protein
MFKWLFNKKGSKGSDSNSRSDFEIAKLNCVNIYKNMYLNKRVIIVNNEGENCEITTGKVVGFEQFKNGGSVFPIVKIDDKEEKVICMGCVIKYDDNIKSILEKLTIDERCMLVGAFVNRFQG